MQNIRTKGWHQVISAPTSQVMVRREDAVTANLGTKDGIPWVYFRNAAGALVWDCNDNYFRFHFEYASIVPTNTSKEQTFRRWFEAQAGRSPVSMEEQATLRNTTIPELKQKLRIAEQRLQNAINYEGARLWAQKAWEMKQAKE